ncbi:MAG: dependent ligase [Anaerocolumna sp.]|jgi:ATP-dependent DNA ligase|nr:dependent ligase [Anaerocolumna sp.]
MDIFEAKAIHPMLIKDQQQPFNSPDYLYELKLDGIRCIAYLNDDTDLRNKRDFSLISKFPELVDINKQVKTKCILDGELVALKNNKPDFYELQRRVILTDKFKIQQAYLTFPASFVAYDIIYYENKEIVDMPLIERKRILSEVVIENPRIAVSRYIEEYGIELFNLADAQKLEGVVAKKKNSRYQYDKRSKDWIKFKRIETDVHIICGYIKKDKKHPLNTLILGKMYGVNLKYSGSVSFGVRLSFLYEYKCKPIPFSPFDRHINNTWSNQINWIEPIFKCKIEYMPNSKNSLRQPVFKGIVGNRE